MIEKYILVFRGHRVMLSTHLAQLYGVKPKALLQAVKRNKERFPLDFMFQLTWAELEPEDPGSRSQIVTLNRGANIKYLPYAFTEQGVAMLSSVLKSRRAIQANIAIMRTFVQLKTAMMTSVELAQGLERLEAKFSKHDEQIRQIFDAIRQLISPPDKPKREIGFHSR